MALSFGSGTWSANFRMDWVFGPPSTNGEQWVDYSKILPQDLLDLPIVQLDDAKKYNFMIIPISLF